MGINLAKICGSKPQLSQLIAQATSTSKTLQVKVPPLIERVSSKPTFHKICPVKFQSAEVQNQVQSDTQSKSNQQSQPQILVNSQQQTKQVFKGTRHLSLQQILFQAQKKIEHCRIGVNWNSFVKIKKRNYLQDYVFLKEIGKGAYGSVLKVKMKYGGLLRAAKVMKSSLVGQDKNSCGKLFAQILVPIRLDHPNLVKLYEVFEFRGQYVLIMQLCEGGDLFHNIRKSRFFSECKAGHLIRQILSAVNYMHKRKVIHRDLKPENILIDHQSDTLKIADFGTAVFNNLDKKLNDVVGTPYYIAPEVINGNYDQKCDIWSCGVILYILLCGSPPFNGKNEKEIMDNVKYRPLQFKNPIWQKRNKKAIELVRLMLNKNASERITAEEALNSQWLTSLPNLDAVGKQKINQIQFQVINNLQTFHFKNRLKAVVYTFIASQLYSNKDKDNLLKIFRGIDKDGDGVIQRSQLLQMFNTHSRSPLAQGQIQKILALVDTNGSGQIDFTQFLVAASNQQKLLQEKRLENAFNYLDSDHSGFITIQEVKTFLDGTQETNEEIKKIFDQVDQNGDGEISKKEFMSLLLKKD